MNTDSTPCTPKELPEEFVLISDAALRDLAVVIAAMSTMEQLHYLVHLFHGVAVERKRQS